MEKITIYFHVFLFFICGFMYPSPSHIFADSPIYNGVRGIEKLNSTVAPPNDECANAILLGTNSNQNCSTYALASFSAATVSPEGGTPCTAVTPKDIWYKFNATSTSHDIQLSNFSGTPQPVVIMLYEGSLCGSLTQLKCSTNNYVQATGLTVGLAYKIRIYYDVASPDLSGSFRVCITTPPPPVNNNQADCLIGTANPNFENPANGNASLYPTFVNHHFVQGWRTTASDQMMEFWPTPNYENVVAPSGTQFIELNANLVSGIYQDYDTPVATVFNYSFKHRGRMGTDTCQLLAGPPQGPFLPVTTAATGTSGWGTYTGTYTVPTSQLVTRFIFQSVSSVGGASVGNFLDSILFTANNGITTPSPYNMACFTNTAAVSAAGIGTWVASPFNPSVTTITSPTANTTTITGFSASGYYQYDWVTQYCTSTIDIIFNDGTMTGPGVTNVVYCVNETATPLTATPVTDYGLYWYTAPTGGTPATNAPIPTTTIAGTTTYYVSQISLDGCESNRVPITITVQTLAPTVTGFTIPAAACAGSANIAPVPAAGFTAGGVFSAGTGLALNPSTGEIDITTSLPGNYTVTYTVATTSCTTGGSSTMPLQITGQPGAVSAVPVQATCTTAVAAINVTAPTGAGLTYSIDGATFQPGTTFSNVLPGTYTVTVKNAGNCTSVSQPVTIDPIPVVPGIITTNLAQPDCTTATGSITVTAPLSTGLTYSIDGVTFQQGTVFTDIAPGNYTVTAKNTDNCTSLSAIAILPQPVTPALPVIAAIQPVCGTPTGILEVTSPTGTGITYSIDNGVSYQVATTFTGLMAGQYTIIAKNAAGCTSLSAVQTINPALAVPGTVTATLVHPTCLTATGGFTITAPTGNGLTYSIDGITFGTITTYTGLAPGSYTITAKNSDNCTSSSTVTILPQPATPAVPVVNVTQPICGTPTGSLTVTSPIGNGLTYSINNGSTYQATAIFTGLAPGQYSVMVKNAAGCTNISALETINPALTVPGPVTTAIIQPDCSTATGSFTIISPVGNGMVYSVNNSAFTTNTVYGNLPAGSYNVIAKNNDGCTSSTNVNIVPQPVTPAAPVVTLNQPTCTMAGSIVVNSPLGNGLTYSINGTVFQAGTTFTSVPAGTYTITVKNTIGGCTNVLPLQTINAAPPVPGALTFNVIHPTCTIATGSITVTSPTGNVMTYSIDNGVTYQSGTTFSNYASGVYTIIAKNSFGCTTSQQVTINPIQNTPAIPVIVLLQPTCTNAMGTLTVSSPTGSGLQYSINGGTTYQNGLQFSVPQGSYTVMVKNSAGCTSVSSPQVINAQPITPAMPDLAITQPNCTTTTGQASVNTPLTGGTYKLDNGAYQSGTTFTTIAPGSHIITVMNADGCTASKTFVIAQPPTIPAVALYVLTQPDCDTATGTIVVTAPQGAGLRYSINNGVTDQISTVFTNVVPGNYSITVTNAAGCTSQTGIFTIDNPPAAAPSPGVITGNTEVCVGGSLQLANIVPGGVWGIDATGYATIDATGLVTADVEGTVVVTYTVGTTCTATAQKTIRIVPLPEPVLRNDFICIDPLTGQSGTADLNTGLSTVDYSFEWKLGATILPDTGSAIVALAPGEYTVNVTRLSTGCTGSTTAQIVRSSVANAVAEVGNDFQFRQTINVTVTSGYGDYEYSINGVDFQESPNFGNIFDGDYTITIRDKNGCGTTEVSVYAINYPRFFSPNGDGSNDSWNITGLRDQTNCKIYIFDRFGKVITMVVPDKQGWDGTFNGASLPATDYWFHLYYQSGGENKEFKSHFSLIR